jgi:hypothetical protein
VLSSIDYTFHRPGTEVFTTWLGLAEAALGEGSSAKLHKLSVKDIKYVSELGLSNRLHKV